MPYNKQKKNKRRKLEEGPSGFSSGRRRSTVSALFAPGLVIIEGYVLGFL